ncbi:hypothetical protein HJG60_008971 [Phyllostomus discolor]|uniref:Uncharacterized protein n=1 Tax=Phyllostomus discolor TaxID=89673 RepID=A0A833YWM3_9CHIR|nr:hypothetical protein HJG60_008971 [Phyllostomus discolor]
MYSAFRNSWKSFLKKMFLYHQKRKMIIYVVIYFGCITLVLILKPRNGTQPQMLWKACQSPLCPFPDETRTLSASSKGKPLCPQPLPWSVCMCASARVFSGSLALPCATFICSSHPPVQPAPSQPWAGIQELMWCLLGAPAFLSPWDSAVTSTSRCVQHSVWGQVGIRNLLVNTSSRAWSIGKDGLPVALHWCVSFVLCASAPSCPHPENVGSDTLKSHYLFLLGCKKYCIEIVTDFSTTCIRQIPQIG